MKTLGRLAALLAATSMFTGSAYAQQNLESTSGSESNANSGSVSGASSDNYNSNGQGQQQTANNAGIGNSESVSVSGAAADSASVSRSESNGNIQGQGQDQGQSQGQSANNAQTQGQNLANTNTLGQGNQQGVTFNQTWNTTQRKKTIQEFRTNTPVMLAASSSFSSDYCGGTVSGGASTSAPIGLTIGASGTKYDRSCRYLRLAEKAGMLGANYHNMGQPDMAMKSMSMMAWAVCMAGPEQDKKVKKHHRYHSYGSSDNYAMEACLKLGLLGSDASPASPPPAYVPPPPPAMESQQPNGTYYEEMPPKTPRGDLNPSKVPGHTTAAPAFAGIK